jgi:hypothetical protein
MNWGKQIFSWGGRCSCCGTAAVNGVHLWYAVFGHGSPVILVHGGLPDAITLKTPVSGRSGNWRSRIDGRLMVRPA